jgi:hypothetical protein
LIIHVHVVDSAGQPISGASVYVSAAPRPLPDIAQLTDESGTALVGAPEAGRYVIGARFEAAVGTATVDVADADVDARLVLSESG